jgi:hypothetical protein
MTVSNRIDLGLEPTQLLHLEPLVAYSPWLALSLNNSGAMKEGVPT